MKKRILIINGNNKSQSFCKAIADAYQDGAKEHHEIRRIDIRTLHFNPVLVEGYTQHKQELEEDLVKAQQDILWCSHIVLVYPTWWGQMPALLKGFFDRAFLPRFAFSYTGKFFWKRLLRGRSARIITTTSGPRWFYQVVLFGGGHRVVKYLLFRFCGFFPVRITHLSWVDKVSDKKRKKWLEKINRLGTKGA